MKTPQTIKNGLLRIIGKYFFVHTMEKQDKEDMLNELLEFIQKNLSTKE